MRVVNGFDIILCIFLKSNMIFHTYYIRIVKHVNNLVDFFSELMKKSVKIYQTLVSCSNFFVVLMYCIV